MSDELSSVVDRQKSVRKIGDYMTFGMPQIAFGRELAFALDICEQAGKVAMSHLERGITAESKKDGSPVTAADKECERLIRTAIEERYPEDSILGEEEDERVIGDSKRRWIIDPIDGTYNYARKVPFFATLLALESDGDIVIGVVHAPAMAETYWAQKGFGAFRNGGRISVSSIREADEAQFNFGSPDRILSRGYWDGLRRIVECTKRQRGFGDYLGFAHVFCGQAEAMLEVGVYAWDLAPMKIIVEEAGGRFTDLEGGVSIHTGSCLISNGKVHDELLNALQGN